MSRRRTPRPRDLALLGAVGAVWLACFALHLDASLRRGLAWIPLVTERAASPDDYPRAVAFWSEADRSSSTVAPGDRLLAAGEASLRGSRGFTTAARIYAAAAPDGRVSLRVRRDGGELEAALSLRPVLQSWRLSLLAAAFFAIGALAYWHASRQSAARLMFLSAVGYSLHLAYFWGGAEPRSQLGFAVFGAGLGLALPLALRAGLSFPEDVARRDAASRAWPWLFALAGIGAPSWAFGAPLPQGIGFALTVGGSVAALGLLAAILALHWRRTGPIGRRQIKWVLLGALVAFAPPILLGTAALVRPDWWWLYELSVTALILLPIAILIALVRDHLFDVDRLLTAAASYTLLCALLLGSIIVVVPRAASALEGVIDPAVSQPALALAAAVVLLAARSRLEPWLDRRLFPERIRFERGARALRDELAGCEKPAQLFGALGERLEALLTPESLVVYGRSDDAFAPLFESARAVVPSIALDGPLATELEFARRVVDVETATRGDPDDPLLRAERGALEAMGSELVLPVVVRGRLEAFACLGPKRSGTAYGASELALLQSVVDKAGDELRRFDLEEVHRDQRAMCERLRRYVPGALAARLEEGREAPMGERQVTMLFVDIRGYVSLAERRDPRAVFSFVSRYARTASEVLQKRGGTIIDVQGDGLMAVFGAPERAPDKERQALAAAREVISAIRGLPIEDQTLREGAAGGERIDVGVGIATGRAYVGSLRTVDRSFWAVVGDTVNLAARCQALTRELDAVIVIDARTHAAAGAPSDLLPSPAMPIRGRRERVDLYRLPLIPSVPTGASPSEESR